MANHGIAYPDTRVGWAHPFADSDILLLLDTGPGSDEGV